jgi:hypothetical protein
LDSMTSHTRTRHFGLFAAAALVASALIGSTAQADEPRPEIGDCLQVDDAFSGTSGFTVVDCIEMHNSEVYEVVAYPDDLGAPSTLTDQELSGLGDECSWEAFDAWLGADVMLPLKIWSWLISVPSDEAWEAGDRDILCRTVRPTPRYDALNYKGAIPDLFASTPVLQWLSCTTKAPKSGADNPTASCGAKSVWLLLGGEQVKGKVTAKYPKDLQAAADKACQAEAKRYAKPGTKAVAALLSKVNVSNEWIYADCYIPVKNWNGKVK